MPTSLACIDRGMERMLAGTRWLHLHGTGLPSSANRLPLSDGYDPISIVRAGWVGFTEGRIRIWANVDVLRFPTPGATWPVAEWVGMWDREDISPNVDNPPGLIRAFSLAEMTTAMFNDSLQIDPRQMRIAMTIG